MFAELAPVATRAQLSARVRLPLLLRIGCGLLALALTAGFLWVSIAGAVAGLRNPSSLDSVGRGDDSVIIENYLAILVLALFALVVVWGANGIRAGGFPRGVARAAGQLFTGTAALVYVPLIICTTVQVVLTVLGAVPQASGIQSSAVVGLVTSLGSGVAEEVFVVAVPVALVDALLRGRLARPPARWPWLPSAIVVAVLAAARISYHIYYGWTALVLLPWAVLSVVVYLRTRAILPLMVCHVAYDAVLQLPGVLGLAGVLVLAGMVVGMAHRRVRRSRAASAVHGPEGPQGPHGPQVPPLGGWGPGPGEPGPWAPGPRPPISSRGPAAPWGPPAPPAPARDPRGPSPYAPPDRSSRR